MRLFVGVWPPEGIVDGLVDAQKELQGRVARGVLRMTRPEQIHLTLQFLGEVPEEEVGNVETRCREVVRYLSAMTTMITSLGAFPSAERPRILWAGVQDEGGLLSELHSGIRRALEEFTEKGDEQRFHPHLTLARVGEARSGERRSITEALDQIRVWPRDPWMITEVRLVASRLGPRGSVYSTLASMALLKT